MWVEGTPSWMQQLFPSQQDQVIPDAKEEAHKFKRKVAHFVLQDVVLYKKGFLSHLLWCIEERSDLYPL